MSTRLLAGAVTATALAACVAAVPASALPPGDIDIEPKAAPAAASAAVATATGPTHR